MNHKDKVSIIIPTYSRSDMLHRAIDSALNQTYPNVEIIVVDDNGVNTPAQLNTEKTMQKYSENEMVKYVKHQTNKGVCAARNTAVKHSTGQYIAFLDDDDEFLPDKIDIQIKSLKQKDSSWCGSYCGCNVVKDNKVIRTDLGYGEGNLTKELLLMENPIHSGVTLVIRKDVFNEIGGFDETLVRHEDWEFLLRVFKKYKLCFTNKVLANIHFQSNNTRVNSGNRMEQVKKKYLDAVEDVINQYDKKTQKMIYRNHYFFIANAYMLERKIFKSLEWIISTNIIYPFNRKQNSTLFKSFIKCFVKPHSISNIKKTFKKDQ